MAAATLQPRASVVPATSAAFRRPTAQVPCQLPEVPGEASSGASDVRVAALATAALGVVSRSRQPRVKRNSAARHSRGTTAVHTRATALAEAPVEVVEEEQIRRFLNDKWEHALAGRVGDVWTEPEFFSDLAGCLNAGPGDEQMGSLCFERVSLATEGDLVLYLSGIDFTGAFGATQFRGLAEEGHELWRCYVSAEDRTPFAKMADRVEAWLRPRCAGRRVILFGESFGGLLGLEVALRLGEELSGLLLVNPATSYAHTIWPLLGRVLAALPRSEGLPEVSEGKTDAEFLEEMPERFAQSPYAYIGSMALCGSIADSTQLGRIFARIFKTSASGDANGVNPLLQGFLRYPEEIAKIIPPETLKFRLKSWLRDGCESVGTELRAISPKRSPLPPTVLLLSKEDRLLASASEEERLRPLIEPRCGRSNFQVIQLDAGHAPLDARVELAAVLRDSPICKPKPGKRDYVKSYTPPTLEVLEQGSSNIEPIAELVSPVFVSYNPVSGKRELGLAPVPDPSELGRPVIFVGNHQLIALDLGPLVREFLIEKGYAPRGLAHPINFPETLAAMVERVQQPAPDPELLDFLGLPFELRSAARAGFEGLQALLEEEEAEGNQQGPAGAQESAGQSAGVGENFGMGFGFATWGAVPVTPKNFFRLMQRGDATLLFPGGAKEACHGAREKYRLMWPERTDFVRVAAKFNAVVVPFGSIGSADNVRFIPDEVGALIPGQPPKPPVELMQQDDGLMPVSESLKEPPRFPSVLPRFPPAGSATPGFGDRFYYSFGQPVDCSSIDPKDREACDKLYGDLKQAVEGEIAWLLEARTRDPYRDFIKRQAFERVANLDRIPREIKAGPLKGSFVKSCGQRAPTFEL